MRKTFFSPLFPAIVCLLFIAACGSPADGDDEQALDDQQASNDSENADDDDDDGSGSPYKPADHKNDGSFDDCLHPASTEPGDFVYCIVAFDPGSDADFGQDQLPDIVYGPPEGTGIDEGSTDTLSLGCGGSITLAFAGLGITDGDGMDFIIFENPLITKGSSKVFVEPAEVLVSDDLENWTSFGCLENEDDQLAGCAGIEPVFAASDNEIDPFDRSEAGGDAFDLADVGLERVRFVKIVDLSEEYYGSRRWCGPAGGFDLDAAAVVNPAQ